MSLKKKILKPEDFARGLVDGNSLIDEIRQRGGVAPATVLNTVLRALYVSFGPTGMSIPLQAKMFTCTVT